MLISINERERNIVWALVIIDLSFILHHDDCCFYFYVIFDLRRCSMTALYIKNIVTRNCIDYGCCFFCGLISYVQ